MEKSAQYEAIILKANESSKAGVVFSEECLEEIARKTKGMRYENGCLIASVSVFGDIAKCEQN